MLDKLLMLSIIGLLLLGLAFIVLITYCFIRYGIVALRVAWEMAQDRKYRRDERKGIEEG